MPLRQPGRLPFLRFLIRDFFMFMRQGLSPSAAWSAAFDYWKFDRKSEKPW